MPLSRVQGASLSPAIPSRFPACSPIAAQACRCSGPVSRTRSTGCGPSSILRRCCRSGRCRCLPSATGSISSSSSSRVTPASARSRSRASCGSGVVPITLSINAVADLQLVQAVLDRLSLGQQRALLGCRAALLSPVRQRGRRLVGITCSNAVQGVAGATGLGAVIVGVQPLVAAINWAGIVYLAFLAVQALRSAAGRYLPFDHEKTRPSVRPRAGGKGSYPTSPTSRCLSSTSLCCPSSSAAPINPRTRRAWAQPRRASLLYLLRVVTGLARARRVPSRRPVRRALDAMTGVAPPRL
jgi:LysE type translocator